MRTSPVRRLPAAPCATLLTLACAAGAAACASPKSVDAPSDGVGCTAEYVYGLAVEVRDSVSGAPLGGARGVVRDGAYVDTLRPVGAPGDTTVSVLDGAGERAGTYTVELTRPGYRAFTRSGIVVTRDQCHVHPQRVQAAMVRDG